MLNRPSLLNRSTLAERSIFLVSVVACTAAALPAKRRVAVPPVRNIGAVLGRSKSAVGTIEQLLELPDGRVMINDSRKQNLVILDRALDKREVIFGRGAGKQNAQARKYPRGGGVAMPYRGDSLLFANPRSRNFLVLDKRGNLGREAPFPAGASPQVGNNSPYGMRADHDGGIVYWTAGQRCGRDPKIRDSTPLLRTNLKSLSIDTIGYARRFLHECARSAAAVVSTNASAKVLTHLKSLIPVAPPAAGHDEWALLSDGTVAVLRDDYSIDWISAGGKVRSTPHVLPNGPRISVAEKAAIVDTLRTYYRRVADSIIKKIAPNYPPYKRLTPAEAADIKADKLMPHIPMLKDIPDDMNSYRGPVRVDGADNLWIPEAAASDLIRQTHRKQVHPTVYFVVNREGLLIDRVRIPDGSTLVGFGHNVVYYTAREGRGLSLVRANLR